LSSLSVTEQHETALSAVWMVTCVIETLWPSTVGWCLYSVSGGD